MHSEQSNFDACWKSAKFYALISECLDLKDSSKRSFLSTNQNRCKSLEDHMMPKSRCPRIALKCWYYHYQYWNYSYEASDTFLNFATIPISDYPRQVFHALPYWSSKLHVFNSSQCFQFKCDYKLYSKCVQTWSATSTHVHCFWSKLKKPLQNHHEQNQSVVPWCLRHRCRSIADSDAWSFDWSSTSPPVPSRIQLCKAALRFHKWLPPQHLQ